MPPPTLQIGIRGGAATDPEGRQVTGARRGICEMENPEALMPFRSDQAVILIAEDEVMLQNFVRIALEADGYFLLTAQDGEQALEIARSFPGVIHLLLTDFTMPRLNGLELCRRLGQDRPNTQVLMMSAIPPLGEFQGPVLHKPFTIPELRTKVREIISCPVAPAAVGPRGAQVS